MSERQSVLKSKITNDGLTRSSTEFFTAYLFPYGKSGRQTVKTYTAQNVDAVEELVLSQENAPGTHRTSSSSDMHSRTH